MDGSGAGGAAADFGATGRATGFPAGAVLGAVGVVVVVAVDVDVFVTCFGEGFVGADAFAAFDAADVVDADLWSVTFVTALAAVVGLFDAAFEA